MEIPSFSSTSWRRCWAPLADAVLLKKTAVPEWNRGSVSMFPRKSACRPLSTQSALLTPKENRMQVFCIQKKEITTVEARSMEEIYNALAERLVPTAAAATNSSFKHIVGLAGPPGAGKSTLANEVVRRINKMWPQKSSSFDSQVEPPEVATVLPMDGFHLYRQQLDAKEDPQEAHARRGAVVDDDETAPWTFDPKRLLSCLRTLRDQGSVYAPSFDHGVGDPVEDDIFVSLQHKVVIVEGNYLLLEEGVWNEISSMFDEKWFIDIDIDKSMKRVLKRHISTGKPPHIAEQRIKYNDKPNAELIYQSKKNADLVIKSSCFRLLARCYEVSIPRLSLFGFIVTAQRCNFPSSCSFKESKVSIPLQKHQGQGQGPSGAVESAWMSSNKNYNEHESSLSLTAGVGYSRGFEYWNSRREFLSSYKLSEGDYGITEKVRMSTKGMREVAVEIVVRIRDEMSKRRVGVRVYRFTIVCLTLFIVRFFLPCVFIQKINTM